VQENFADTRTVEEAQRRITMKRTSTVTASMSAKLPQEHLGSIEELDGYVLIHRFDSVQIKSGTPRKIIEYLVHTTCDGTRCTVYNRALVAELLIPWHCCASRGILQCLLPDLPIVHQRHRRDRCA